MDTQEENWPEIIHTLNKVYGIKFKEFLDTEIYVIIMQYEWAIYELQYEMYLLALRASAGI